MTSIPNRGDIIFSMRKRGGKARKVSLWQKTRSKYKAWYNKRKKTTVLLSLLAIVLLVYGLFVGIEWAQFKIAERKVDDLYSQTLQILGEPEEKSIDGSCGYASAKFHRGDLGCGYGFSITYKATDIEKANAIANRFAELMETQKTFHITSKTQERPVDLGKLYFGRSEVSYQQKETIINLSCTARIMNAGEDGYYLPRGTNDRVIIGFSCDKSPLKRPIYPVKD